MKKLVSILASALLLVTMFAVFPVSAAVDKTVNICLGLDPKTAYKLSSDTGRAVSTFDGKLTTASLAASNGPGNDGDATPFHMCDFGKVHWIDRYVVYPYYDFGGYHFAVTHFQLKVSLDGKNWTVVHEVKTTEEEIGIEDNTFTPVKARYIRVDGLESCDGFMRFPEIEVYATDPPEGADAPANTTTKAPGNTTKAPGTTTKAPGTTTKAPGTTTKADGTTTIADGTTTTTVGDGTTTIADDTTTTTVGDSTTTSNVDANASTGTTTAAGTNTPDSEPFNWLPIIIGAVVVAGIAVVVVVLVKKKRA